MTAQSITLKGGFTTQDRRFDRLPEWHAQNMNYPIRRLTAPNAKPRSYTWPVGPHMTMQTFLDQGQEGECVGFAWTHELIARPVQVPAGEEMAHTVYKNAQQLDEWPGEDYSGTSVIAGVRYLTLKGYYSSYAWTRDAYELAVAISRHGPCVIGVNWYEGMMDPDRFGFLNLNGAIVGGHAILVKGYSLNRRCFGGNTPAFTVHNSWGPDWGVKGCAYIDLDDMQTLLNQDGEACLPLRVPYANAIVR